MTFTAQHKEVLDKHVAHWETLRDAGYISNLDNPKFQELKTVYEETVNAGPVNQYCNSCVAEMITRLYRAYEASKQAEVKAAVKPASPKKK